MSAPVVAQAVPMLAGTAGWWTLDLRAELRADLGAGEDHTDPHVAAQDAEPAPWDVVDEWGMDSFPASDPPANW